MADTLEEIHEASLVESDFDSNGETTLFTTDTATRHVIKDVQVKQGDADINIDGTLSINGYDTVSLSANSSGSSIVGTSNAVKVKTTAFPLRYTDLEFNHQTEAGNLRIDTLPLVNDVEGKASLISTNYNASSWYAGQNDAAFRQYWQNIGSNNYKLFIQDDGNAGTNSYLISSNGSQAVTSYTGNYRPKWFDGSRYLYNAYTSYLYRADLSGSSTNQSTYVQLPTSFSASTYPKIFGGGKYVMGWGQYTSSNGAWIVDTEANTSRRILQSGYTPNDAFQSHNKRFFLIRITDDFYLMCKVNNTTQLHVWGFNPKNYTFAGNNISYSLVNIASQMAGDMFSTMQVGTRVYYTTSGNKIGYIDFAGSTPQGVVTSQGEVDITIPSGPYGQDLWGGPVTPSSATISGRTYNMSPSLGVRLSGVTSA